MRSVTRLRGSLAALVSIAAVACLAAPAAAGAAAPGVTVDDGAGVLSGATDRLHAAGQGLAAKRIPVLVATRSKQASSQQAVITEGQALLRDRQVESAPNARDGVVILLDVAPGGGRSFGAVVLGGRFSSYVPSSEPTTVYQNAMLPLLRSSDYAGAVSAGLTTLDNDLGSYSPPSGQAAPSRPGQAPAPASSSSSFPWLPVILVVVLVLVIGGAALALLRRRSGGSGGGYFASGGQSWVPPGGQPGAGYGPAGPGYGYGSGGGIGRGAAAAGGLLGGGLAGGLLGYELGKESGERQERDRELADGGYGGAQSGYPGGDDASGGSFGGGGDWGGDAGGGGGGDWGGGGDFGGGGGDGGGGGGDGGF